MDKITFRQGLLFLEDLKFSLEDLKEAKAEVFNLWAMAQLWATALFSVGHRALLESNIFTKLLS